MSIQRTALDVKYLGSTRLYNTATHCLIKDIYFNAWKNRTWLSAVVWRAVHLIAVPITASPREIYPADKLVFILLFGNSGKIDNEMSRNKDLGKVQRKRMPRRVTKA